jgi:hypothetical protein
MLRGILIGYKGNTICRIIKEKDDYITYNTII